MRIDSTTASGWQVVVWRVAVLLLWGTFIVPVRSVSPCGNPVWPTWLCTSPRRNLGKSPTLLVAVQLSVVVIRTLSQMNIPHSVPLLQRGELSPSESSSLGECKRNERPEDKIVIVTSVTKLEFGSSFPKKKSQSTKPLKANYRVSPAYTGNVRINPRHPGLRHC